MSNHAPASRRSLLILITGAILFSLASCDHNGNNPAIDAVTVKEVHISRFDTAFFSMDSNDIEAGLHKLAREYPWFTGDFVGNILGAGPLSDTSRLAFQATRQFLVSYLPVKDSLDSKYHDLGWLEKDLTKGFRYCKYYFPQYNLPPKVVAYIGPFDGPGVAITSYALAIGLQSYAGQNMSFYQSAKGQDLYPLYVSRRFEPEYITANCLMALAQDIIPDSSENHPLIEQMIIKGKYLWLESKLLPDAPDSIRSGYSASQLKWCASNEAGVWNYFLQNTDLFTVDPDLIKNYIGESPKTIGMPDAAPGNIGAWVGWQIVKKYAAGISNIEPNTLMRTPAKKIFEDSKYKPR